MRPTKKKADELCWDKWNWQYHNPSKDTKDWPRWKFNGGDVPKMEADCPYCHIYTECKGCPLRIENDIPCVSIADKLSWFQRWNRAKTPKTRKKYARLIRDVAGKRLGLVTIEVNKSTTCGGYKGCTDTEFGLEREDCLECREEALTATHDLDLYNKGALWSNYSKNTLT